MTQFITEQDLWKRLDDLDKAVSLLERPHVATGFGIRWHTAPGEVAVLSNVDEDYKYFNDGPFVPLEVHPAQQYLVFIQFTLEIKAPIAYSFGQGGWMSFRITGATSVAANIHARGVEISDLDNIPYKKTASGIFIIGAETGVILNQGEHIVEGAYTSRHTITGHASTDYAYFTNRSMEVIPI